MNKVFRLLGTGLLAPDLLASGPALQAQTGTGAAQPAPARDDWQQLMQVASIETVLWEMPGYLREGLAQAKAQGAPISPEVEAALNAAADEVFGFAGLRDMARAHLVSSLSAEQLADWLAFYRSPVGQKLAQADARAVSPAFQRQCMERAPQLMETLSTDPDRMALLQFWLQATDAVEQTTNLALQTQLALEWGLVSTMPQAIGKPTFKEMQSHFEGQRFAMRAQMAQFTLIHAAAAYQDFSQEELGQLLKQANSPAAKALYIDFFRKLYQTLFALAEKTGQTAGRKLAQQSA